MKENTLWRLIFLLERPEANENVDDKIDASPDTSLHALCGWTVLEGLSSSPSIVNCILSTSVWLELLGVLVGYKDFTKLWSARIGAAKALSRLLWDPSQDSRAGTYWNLNKFLFITDLSDFLPLIVDRCFTTSYFTDYTNVSS
jgi:hypothetical protein